MLPVSADVKSENLLFDCQGAFVCLQMCFSGRQEQVALICSNSIYKVVVSDSPCDLFTHENR